MTKSYVIHLAASTARTDLVSALVQTLPGGQVLDAVDGRKMSAQECAQVSVPHLLDPRYPFPLMPSEIGCFLSHRKTWKAIAEGEADFGFVAEDDVVTTDGFADALQIALDHADRQSLIRFPMAPREKPKSVVATKGDVTLFRPQEIGLTAALYLLGKDAAHSLWSQSERFDRPVDTWLQMRWETGVDSLTLWPSCIKSAAASHGGSTIQKKRSRMDQLKRTWHRTRYRAAITSLSKGS